MDGIYAIEGLGGAGKSTILKKMHELGYSIVPELCEMRPETQKIQEFTQSTYDADKTNEWFIQWEIVRIEVAEQRSPAFLDRSIYSQIAYNYAKDMLFGTHHLLKVINRILDIEQSGRALLSPMIFLETTVEHSLAVMAARNKQNEQERIINRDHVYTQEFQSAILMGYQKLVHLLGDNAFVIPMPKNQNEAESLICDYIHSHSNHYFMPARTLLKLELPCNQSPNEAIHETRD